ncbi:hypothetical protein DKG34_10900 [Streptomyces sp. NWU49]|uniref:hypothetical protein n=1 Tax=Streptomyces sp. NWU49 TaxID=2201153 RepID=UPI000D67E209|nr:hypothetical protein [Streptomyces sp. NWU49]PWJ07906.1 hypothetical protein DKG34_10900 [Streptomyces sp. NWU49]
MTKRVKTMEAAPVLGLPLPDPEPAPGCKNCQGWARRRETARAAGNWTRVSDFNVLIRRCVH